MLIKFPMDVTWEKITRKKALDTPLALCYN